MRWAFYLLCVLSFVPIFSEFDTTRGCIGSCCLVLGFKPGWFVAEYQSDNTRSSRNSFDPVKFKRLVLSLAQ